MRSTDVSVPSSTPRPWPQQYARQPLRIDWTLTAGAEPFPRFFETLFACLPPPRARHLLEGILVIRTRRIECAGWGLQSFPGRRVYGRDDAASHRRSAPDPR